jgi:5-deoxy-glucuronate isomerase
MSFLIRKEIQDGYNEILPPTHPLLNYLSFGLIALRAGGIHQGQLAGREATFVVLKGKCNIVVGSSTYREIGERQLPFAGRAYAAYAPVGATYRIEAISDIEVAVCIAKAEEKKSPCLITPDKVKERIVGKDNWQRSVFDIVGSSVDACRLLVGETINPPGNWSSVPPHRHDFDNLPEESNLEEAYFFRVDPPQGFGVIRLYNDDLTLDETHSVVNNDLVIIPEGYHPVGALAGYRLYYLWMLAGEKRVLQPKDDPRHSWLKFARTGTVSP